MNKDYQPEVGVEPRVNAGEQSHAKAETERRDEQDEHGKLLEQILNRGIMNNAYSRVKGNGGSAGVDGMTTDELLGYLKVHKQSLLHDLLTGKYRSQAVRRVEISKPKSAPAPSLHPTRWWCRCAGPLEKEEAPQEIFI
ncbi:MAG: hypothetical protein ABIX01_02910 [Chitinophagaceae bacterium]